MKTFIINTALLAILSVANLSQATACGSGKIVANCGKYQLIQNTSSAYFAGILHQENTYQIKDPNGNLHGAGFKSNSEGATIDANVILPLGSKEPKTKITILALFGAFNLRIEQAGLTVHVENCEMADVSGVAPLAVMPN